MSAAEARTPEVLTTGEIADAYGVAISTVCRWAELGQIPVIRKLPGKTGQWVFGPEALPATTPPPEPGD